LSRFVLYQILCTGSPRHLSGRSEAPHLKASRPRLLINSTAHGAPVPRCSRDAKSLSARWLQDRAKRCLNLAATPVIAIQLIAPLPKLDLGGKRRDTVGQTGYHWRMTFQHWSQRRKLGGHRAPQNCRDDVGEAGRIRAEHEA